MTTIIDELRDLEQRICDRYPLPKQIAIAGALPHGQRIMKGCKKKGIEVVALYDSNPELIGSTIEGFTVQPITEAHTLPEFVPLVLCTQRLLAMQQQLAGVTVVTGTRAQQIPFPVLSLHDPVAFPPHPFFQGLHDNLLQHQNALKQVRERLDDSLSRSTFDAVLAFRRTLDPETLRSVVVGDEYLARDVLPLSDHEVVVDGGSYTGDTITSLLNRTQTVRKIIAFEPDEKNFKKLKENYGNHPQVKCLQNGLYRCATQLRFSANGREDAAFSEEGEMLVSVVALDQVPEAQKVTFLRLNIEGAEENALEGARELLLRQRPKMAIAIYHRPEHLWRIPLSLAKLLPHYRFYLRQHEGGLVETVLYAIPEEI